MFRAKVDPAGKIRILPASGGNSKNFIHKICSGRIAYCTILTINALVNKSLNFPPLAGKIRILPATSTFAAITAAYLTNVSVIVAKCPYLIVRRVQVVPSLMKKRMYRDEAKKCE